MRRTWSAAEKRTLSALDRLMQREPVRARIDAAIGRVERRLAADPGAQMAWEAVPLSIYAPGLPETILSSWVFIVRAGAVTGAERHPNSHQRTLSYRGAGDLQTMEDGRWLGHRLTSDGKAPLPDRWATIPVGTWHQVVVRGGNWVVVSFHTAPAEELIEERPGHDDLQEGRRRLYAGESAR